MSKHKVEVAVVGGGPAGLAAAVETAGAGVKGVLLIDENTKAGGQLFKQIHKFFGSEAHLAGTRGIKIGARLLEEVEASGVDIWLDTVVFGLFEGNRLGVINKIRGSGLIEAEKIVIATGASEKVVPFPGWTLPGVMGAGAAQTMVNLHRVLPGRSVLMVGSGNVGLIVSYQLMQAGAEVVAVIEAMPRIGGYGVHASKIRRAGVPIFTSHTIKQANGKDSVEFATIIKLDQKRRPIPGTEKTLKVDTICLAVGLNPLAELAWMAGCKFEYMPELGGFVPLHNEDMETSMTGVYVAGDISGVEEENTAVDEGRLAGISVAESLGYLSSREAHECKQVIRSRLKCLRTGPFGEGRQEAKEGIMTLWSEHHESGHKICRIS